MTKEQEAVLQKCKDGVDFYACSSEEQEVLIWLIDEGYCQFGNGSGVLSETTCRLSQMGKFYLSWKEQLAQEVADKVAKGIREKRSERRFDLLQTLIPIVATLLIEHFGDIVSWFRLIIPRLN